MYRELEAQGEKPAPDEPTPSGECPCTCSESAPADIDDTPAGNRTAVMLEQYWDING